MVRNLIEYMQDKDISLVNGFCLARKASDSETNLDRYPSDGSVPQDLLDAVFNPHDPSNLRGKSSSSNTNERLESEVMDEDEVSSEKESAGDSDSENDAGEDGSAYIIVANGVVDSVQDTVTLSLQRPSAPWEIGRRPGHESCGGSGNRSPHGQTCARRQRQRSRCSSWQHLE